MKMKYLVPAFLAFSLVSGAVLSSDAFAMQHNGSDKGYHNSGGMGMHNGSMSGMGSMHKGGMGGKGCMMGGKGCMMGGMGMHKGMGNMSAEDQAKHNAMYDAYQGKVQPLREQLFVKSQELQALQNATNPDVGDVKKAANELIAIEQKIMQERKKLNDLMNKNFKAKGGM